MGEETERREETIWHENRHVTAAATEATAATAAAPLLRNGQCALRRNQEECRLSTFALHLWMHPQQATRAFSVGFGTGLSSYPLLFNLRTLLAPPLSGARYPALPASQLNVVPFWRIIPTPLTLHLPTYVRDPVSDPLPHC